MEDKKNSSITEIGLESLLKQIHQLNKHYEEIAEITGENYNIFNVLRLAENEISHSRIIANLLNPKGKHNQGDVFFKHFLDVIKEEISEEENRDLSYYVFQKNCKTSEVKVITEKYIGEINKEFTSGGRIDIAISANNNTIVMIENKINAGDQEKQLLRYYNHASDSLLLYLTIDGRIAPDYTLGEGSNISYFSISYKNTILKWLEKCRRDVIDKPFIRETLSQYIILIKNMTGQARSKQMEKDLINTLISSNSNIDSAFLIANNFSLLKNSIIDIKLIPELQKLADAKNLNFEIKPINYLEKYWGFSFHNKSLKSLYLRFEFQAANFGEFIYGFCKYSKDEKLSEELVNLLRQKGKFLHSSESWVAFNYFTDFRNWDKNTFITIVNNENKTENDVIKSIKEKIEVLLDLVKELDI